MEFLNPIKNNDDDSVRFKKEILEEIILRKEVYKKSPADMVSAFNREIETKKEYNGRQLLELLQNADDENSEEVCITLCTEKNILSIKNRGINCTSFSASGIRSLMISNLSTKTSKKYIGNKGLGFRSITNWSEKITIRSNNLAIEFSNKTVCDVFNELFSVEERSVIRKERDLPNSIYPIPFLSIPNVSEYLNKEWNTSIEIEYKLDILDDIKKQLSDLKNEILLFLNSIKKLTIHVDGDCIKSIEKSDLLKKWNVYGHRGIIPPELWDKESEEEYFDLKIAVTDNLHCDIHEIFSYFPTKLAVDFPFIVHGTFELNSSRNEINDSKKNRFILKELVNLIIDTAKRLTKYNTSYKAIELLSYKNKNNILMELGFYDAIHEALNTLSVFPCLDGTYRKKSDVLYVDSLSCFVQSINQELLFENLLIPNNDDIDLSRFELKRDISTEKLTTLSKNIECVEDRASMIYMFHKTFEHKNQFEFLIDTNGNLISLDDEVYTPSTINISIPDYVSIKFINKKLFDILINKFEIDSNDNARELQRTLSKITNIQQYQPMPVLRKIISNANRLIKEDTNRTKEIISKMVCSLYDNYCKLHSPPQIPESKIQLYNCVGTLTDATDLFLSIHYPSGVLNDFLFKNVFDERLFLSEPAKYGLSEDDLDRLEQFFLWLGVNKHTKFNHVKNKHPIEYEQFVFDHIEKPIEYRECDISFTEIDKFEKINKLISLENLVIWFLKDKLITSQLDDSMNTDNFRYDKKREAYEIFSHVISIKPSFIKYQVKRLHIFKDFFFSNDKLSPLINQLDFNFDYIGFEKFGISRSDIESLLLKIGATDKFENLSLDAVRRIIKNLPELSPDGKQAQAIYKLAIKHFDVNKHPLDEKKIKLFAINGEKRDYFDSDEVFYNGNIKLPRKIASSVSILHYPRRQSTQNITQFFGIQNLNTLNIKIKQKSLLDNLTREFSRFLEMITPYILVYRIQDIEKDQSARAELKKLNNYSIELCEDVEYLIEDEQYQLDNNDYIRDKNLFLIKVNPQTTIEELRKKFEFQETFSDIMGLIFDIQDTKIFRDIVKETSAYLEKTIRNDIGEDELIRTRELLGISNEIYSFWKTVYSLLGVNYTLESNDNLTENIISELNLQCNITQINYKQLNSPESCAVIKNIFDALGINIVNFNHSEYAYYQIDFTNYHAQQLKQFFERNLYLFKRILYQWCISNSKESQFTPEFR